MQIHLNVNDYSLKFHVFELSKLPYTIAGLLTLNLKTLTKSNHRILKLNENYYLHTKFEPLILLHLRVFNVESVVKFISASVKLFL